MTQRGSCKAKAFAYLTTVMSLLPYLAKQAELRKKNPTALWALHMETPVHNEHNVDDWHANVITWNRNVVIAWWEFRLIDVTLYFHCVNFLTA